MKLVSRCLVSPTLQLSTISPALLVLPPLLVPRVNVTNHTTETRRAVQCSSSITNLKSRERRIVIQVEGLPYDDDDDDDDDDDVGRQKA